jgi:enamine deaminase RidA (YjgF/YER057c/UK114 family)
LPLPTPTNGIEPVQSQAIKAHGQIFVSGQIPGNSAGILVEGSIGDKTAACCKNIEAILEAAGSSISRVVKVTVCRIKHFAQLPFSLHLL